MSADEGPNTSYAAASSEVLNWPVKISHMWHTGGWIGIQVGLLM